MPVRVDPYLMFEGTASKAIALYKKALGATTEAIQRFRDVPGMQAPADAQDRVMHAMLKVGDGRIMMSDGRPGDRIPRGGNVHVSLDFQDLAEQKRAFDALAAGGTVVTPLEDTFWGARFGMVTDAYGIQWMLNCQTKKA